MEKEYAVTMALTPVLLNGKNHKVFSEVFGFDNSDSARTYAQILLDAKVILGYRVKYRIVSNDYQSGGWFNHNYVSYQPDTINAMPSLMDSDAVKSGVVPPILDDGN